MQCATPTRVTIRSDAPLVAIRITFAVPACVEGPGVIGAVLHVTPLTPLVLRNGMSKSEDMRSRSAAVFKVTGHVVGEHAAGQQLGEQDSPDHLLSQLMRCRVRNPPDKIHVRAWQPPQDPLMAPPPTLKTDHATLSLRWASYQKSK